MWLAVAVAGSLTATGMAASLDIGRILGAGRDLSTAATGIDEKEEIAIGREIAGRVLGAAPLVNDRELQAYVNRVGRWVALQSERPELPWRFGVIDTASINAFATPGGHVLITRGLYELLDSEAQLAGVLGHEIGHIERRHHVTVMQKSAAISAGAQIAQTNRSALLNNLIGNGAEIMARGLDKSAEFEADAIGVVLAARAGYSAFGLIEVLHKLAARGSADASLALLFKTHPQPGERLTQLADAMTPRVGALTGGREPAIRAVSAEAGPVRGSDPVPATGVKALQETEPAGAAPVIQPGNRRGGGIGVDPAGVLRGILGR